MKLLSTSLSSQKREYGDRTEKVTSFGLAIILGREFRKPLGEKFSFRYGADLSADFSSFKTDIDDLLPEDDRVHNEFSWSAGINVLGFNYALSSSIFLGVEVLPRLSFQKYTDETKFNLRNEVTTAEIQGLNFGFSSSNLPLSLVYKF
jgi:hypothetical protein